MEITDVQVTLARNCERKRIKAFADVIFDEVFIVRCMKVVAGRNCWFVGMPRRKTGPGKLIEIAHPLSREMRQTLEDAIFAEYERVSGMKIPPKGSYRDAGVSFEAEDFAEQVSKPSLSDAIAAVIEGDAQQPAAQAESTPPENASFSSEDVFEEPPQNPLV